MSKIEWTEKTWNPIVGCSVVSPGCTNCYAMTMAARLESMGLKRYRGLTKPSKAGPVWTGKTRLVDETLTEPLRRRKPTNWFVNSMSDLFHKSVPDAWIDRVFAIMALSPQHTFQVLTKRSARMRAYMTAPGTFERVVDAAYAIHGQGHGGDKTAFDWPARNVWLGVSTEDQRRVDERVPDLLATPAAVRFVSAEPLLGPIEFSDHLSAYACHDCFAGRTAVTQPFCDEPCPTCSGTGCEKPRLDWIIVGGESGPGARPMHPAWVASIRDQSAAAGVPFFFKQWGSWSVVVDRDKDDPDCRRDYSYALNDCRRDIAWFNADGGRGFHGAGFHVMRRTSKAATGRLLDGIEHNGMPEVRAS